MPDLGSKGSRFKQNMLHRLGLGRWLPKDKQRHGRRSAASQPPDHRDRILAPKPDNRPLPARPTTTSGPNEFNSDKKDGEFLVDGSGGGPLYSSVNPRPVDIDLPRHATFQRQDSEHRDRLTPNQSAFRRTLSADRRRPISSQRTRSSLPASTARLSAPEVPYYEGEGTDLLPVLDNDSLRDPYCPDTATNSQTASAAGDYTDELLDVELDQKWILNLSMHFRDKSDREKFFITYAETPSRWRRVTVSCDYRDAEDESLEQDLKQLCYQRDKNRRIYEAIRNSISEIQFYDTVTNLKLETSEGRLHVHVTEDMNEIVPFPPISSVGHLTPLLIPESKISFESHLSGFAYQVNFSGKSYVKKEITGPDTVEEFLYEINALHALLGSSSVIQFKGVVVDDDLTLIKGLLIEFATKGALVDILYDYRGSLDFSRRERWARQIVKGLSEIHEAGFVQGDLTVSNMVVDENDDAKIIDINRRGCPVGWEPPEFRKKLEFKQRISMYIGVKSDLYQLGMALWALAMEEDEPGRQPRPLLLDDDLDIPDYYRKIVQICLSERPQNRLSAKELLALFPPDQSLIQNEIDNDALNSDSSGPNPILQRFENLYHEVPQWSHQFLEQATDSRLTRTPRTISSADESSYYPLFLSQPLVQPQPIPDTLAGIDIQPYYSDMKPGEKPWDQDAQISISEESIEETDPFSSQETRLTMRQLSSPDIMDEIPMELNSFNIPLAGRASLQSHSSEADNSFQRSHCTDVPMTLAGQLRRKSSIEQDLSGIGLDQPCDNIDSLFQMQDEILPRQPFTEWDPAAQTNVLSSRTDQFGISINAAVAATEEEYPSDGKDLLTSVLPINPAFQRPLSSMEEMEWPIFDLHDPNTSRTHSRPLTTYYPARSSRYSDLFISQLPINPALGPSCTLEEKVNSPFSDLSHSDTTSEIASTPQLADKLTGPTEEPADLLTSCLPINPAFRDPDESSQNVQQSVSEPRDPLRLTSAFAPTAVNFCAMTPHAFDLSTSTLPINPAFRNFLPHQRLYRELSMSSRSGTRSPMDHHILLENSGPTTALAALEHGKRPDAINSASSLSFSPSQSQRGGTGPYFTDLFASKLPINPSFIPYPLGIT